MTSTNSRLYSLTLVIADILLLLLAFTLAYVIRVQFDDRPLVNEIYAFEYIRSSLLIIPFWIMIFATLGLYHPTTYNRRLAEWSRIAIGAFIGILLVIGWQFASNDDILPARLVAVYALIGSFVLIVMGRELLRYARGLMFRFGKGVKKVLIIGSSNVTGDIALSLADTHKSGYEIVAVAGPKNALPVGMKLVHYSNIDTALKNLKTDRVSSIIQTDLYDSTERNQRILNAAQSNHIEYRFIPGEAEFYSGKNTVDVFLGYPMISVHQTPLIGWGSIVKRMFDFIVSIILIILLSPLFILVAILQKILNPGTILYKNYRLSRFSTKINLYKFRSMTHLPGYDFKDASIEFRAMGREDLAEEYDKHRKVENDPRINKFGKLLRATSIDELPQLFNVLKGELSLVGPRPILPQELKMVKDKSSLLLSVKSGVTGLWQVSGRNDLPFDKRIELELYYAQNWSFWLDIKILFKTLGAVLAKRGAK